MAGMNSSPRSNKRFDLETAVRLLLMLNNTVALGLSAGTHRALFVVMSVVFGISLLFNVTILGLKFNTSRQRRWRSQYNEDEDVKCPSLLALAVELLGVVVFLVMYVCSTIETARTSPWGYWVASPLMMAYASIGALVAFIMHGLMAVRNLHAYIRYRQTASNTCPHCHQEIAVVAAAAGVKLPDSPIEGCAGPAQPRQSLSANSVGEAEGDMLILKA